MIVGPTHQDVHAGDISRAAASRGQLGRGITILHNPFPGAVLGPVRLGTETVWQRPLTIKQRMLACETFARAFRLAMPCEKDLACEAPVVNIRYDFHENRWRAS